MALSCAADCGPAPTTALRGRHALRSLRGSAAILCDAIAGAAEIDHDDLGRHPDAYRQDRAAEAARHDQVPVVLHDMTVGESVAEARGHARRIAEDAHLSAVRVAGEGERDARGHLREDVGLVCE